MDWRKVGLVVAIAGALLSVPAGASAALLGTYTPGDNDMNDLDHHMLYAWRIYDTSLASKTIKNATLTFTNLYNWDTTANILNLWLMDTARSTSGSVASLGPSNNGNPAGCMTTSTQVGANTATQCLTQWQDDYTTNATIHFDDFSNSSSLASQNSWLVSSSTGTDELTSRGFAGPGGNPTAAPGGPNPTGWSYVYSGMGTNASNPSGPQIALYTYTYTFSQDDLNSLMSYLDTGNNFAIGLDPDCHYYNDGITLRLFDDAGGQTTSTVPEPATWLLIGTGVALLARRRLTGATR